MQSGWLSVVNSCHYTTAVGITFAVSLVGKHKHA